MDRPLSRNTWPGSAGRATQAGTVLLEVLVAIFIMGIGLLSLLTLFPLGALELAQAINDDRAAAVAADATVLSQAGEELFSRTANFVEVSLSNGLADPRTAAQLREDYEHLALRAENLEVRLEELQKSFPSDEIQAYLGPLLAQIRSIKLRITPIVQILSLLEG